MTDETVTPEWRRWVEAAKLLAADPTARVRCPRLGDGVLVIEDVAHPADPNGRERFLRCPVCGAHNVIRNPTG